jgi:DNA-binding IclR family transcriptional regulator
METLRKMGLAEYEGKGLWRMSPNFKQTLTRMGEQNDILKTLHRAMAKQGME